MALAPVCHKRFVSLERFFAKTMNTPEHPGVPVFWCYGVPVFLVLKQGSFSALSIVSIFQTILNISDFRTFSSFYAVT